MRAHRRPLIAELRRAVVLPFSRAGGVAKGMLITGVVLVALFVLCAIFADLIAPYGFDQYRADDGSRFPDLAPPSPEHLFGTTVRQVDLFSVIAYGARTAIAVVLLSLVLSLLVGVPMGLISGYVGGRLDRALMLVADAMFAFPSLLLAITISFALSSVAGGGILTAAIAITVVYAPQYFRVVRNSVLSVKQEPYVEAARTLGASQWRTAVRYVLPNVIQSIPVVATLNAADAILTLAGLGFLGYGVQPNEAAEWGYELQRALADVGSGVWWTALFPGSAILLFVLGLTLLGEGMNDVFNSSSRSAGRRRAGRTRRRMPPAPSAQKEEGTRVA